MTGSEPTTVILPVNLGDASIYDGDIFPLAYHHAGDKIEKGSFLLSATLDEMIKISEMNIDLNTSQRFQYNAMIQYEILAAKETKLKNRAKSLNPFTMFRNYRAARMFLATAKAFFLETKRTSERMQREEKIMRAVPSNELSAINGQVPQNATIGGIAVSLRGPYDEDVRRKMLAAMDAMRAKASDPFIDNLEIPQLSGNDSTVTLAETASLLSQNTPSSGSQVQESQQETDLMSPGSTFHFHFNHSTVVAGSSVNGTTLNQGDGNQGSNMTEQRSP